MAKREREKEFEVSEVAPLQPLSLASLLLRSLALSHCQYSATVQRSLPINILHCTVLYNDLYQYQC